MTTRRAFTLLEVMLAVALLALLATGIFGMVQSLTTATGDLAYSSRETNSQTSLDTLLSQAFRSLPAEAEILLPPPGSRATPLDGALILRHAPALFTLGSAQPVADNQIALLSAPQLGGLRTLEIATFPADAPALANGAPALEKATRRITLLRDLAQCRWRLMEPSTKEWLDTWRATGLRPALVELTLARPGDKTPQRLVFWLPPLSKTPAPSPPPNP